MFISYVEKFIYLLLQVLGEDLVSCLFSRNWSIRETGLKHLGCEMARELSIVNRDMNSGNTLNMEETLVKLLSCCSRVVAFMCQDPVYRVFVGCLVSCTLGFWHICWVEKCKTHTVSRKCWSVGLLIKRSWLVVFPINSEIQKTDAEISVSQKKRSGYLVFGKKLVTFLDKLKPVGKCQ